MIDVLPVNQYPHLFRVLIEKPRPLISYCGPETLRLRCRTTAALLQLVTPFGAIPPHKLRSRPGGDVRQPLNAARRLVTLCRPFSIAVAWFFRLTRGVVCASESPEPVRTLPRRNCIYFSQPPLRHICRIGPFEKRPGGEVLSLRPPSYPNAHIPSRRQFRFHGTTYGSDDRPLLACGSRRFRAAIGLLVTLALASFTDLLARRWFR